MIHLSVSEYNCLYAADTFIILFDFLASLGYNLYSIPIKLQDAVSISMYGKRLV